MSEHDPLPSFPPARIDDAISHDEALERYPWLSGQILARWRRERFVRHMRGRQGVYVYLKADLDRAIEKEMKWGEAEDHEASSNTRASGSVKRPVDPATIDTGTTESAAKRAVEHFQRKVLMRL